MLKFFVTPILMCAGLLIGGQALAQAPLPYGTPIGVEMARKMAAAAAVEARKNKWAMAITIVEPNGSLVYFEKLDDTQYGSIRVSMAKARTAALFRRPSKAFEDAVAAGRTAVLDLPGATPIQGGLPIVQNGKIIGGIGVSGGASPEDEQVAKAGTAVVK